jgi:hypothetical protein
VFGCAIASSPDEDHPRQIAGKLPVSGLRGGIVVVCLMLPSHPLAIDT